jgi:hypothetical protein
MISSRSGLAPQVTHDGILVVLSTKMSGAEQSGWCQRVILTMEAVDERVLGDKESEVLFCC